MKNFVSIFIIFFVLSGCATTLANDTYNYQPPTLKQIENEITVNKSFSETWDSLVSDLAKTFYVINNIDKESRLLNVSFSSTSNIPDYVDCGITDRSFQLASRNEDVIYEAAGYSEFFTNSATQLSEPNTTYLHIFRQPYLEGRANIYIAPENNSQTKVSVNARYSWQYRAEFDTILYMPLYDSHNRVDRAGRVKDDNLYDPISFNTNQMGGESGGVLCISTGKFETDILKLLN